MAVSAISSFGSAELVKQAVSHSIKCDKPSYGSSLPIGWLCIREFNV